MLNQTTRMMAQQGNGRAEQPSLRAGVSELLHDVLTLAELQWQLTLEDGARWMRTSVYAGSLAVAGAVCALAALSVTMIGISYLLVEAGLPLVWALLITGGAGVILGLSCLYGGLRWLARSMSAFDHSRNELRENLAWVKHSLKSHARKTSSEPTGQA